MTNHAIIYSIFLIFFGAALLATLTLFLRQSMLLAYILAGILIGPWGFKLISDISLIEQIAQVGIIFLLFLLGMSLEPKELTRLLREATIVTVLSSLIFAVTGMLISLAFGFNMTDALVIGLAMMFSSTIIGLKLLPTTALHHQHMGRVMISILLLQDIIAIIVLLMMQAYGASGSVLLEIGKFTIALPMVTGFAFLFSRYILYNLIARFDRIQEYIFLITVGWCLGMAELSALVGLSHEIGAFIGGVSLAINPVCRFITESLKPLRDFFLIMFFFTLGARFNLEILDKLIIPSAILAISMLLLKPFVFRFLLRTEGEKTGFSTQTGFRLGQVSEFSLLIAFLAINAALITENASYVIQITTLLTFVVSSYYIVMRYPTPIAVDDKLRKD